MVPQVMVPPSEDRDTRSPARLVAIAGPLSGEVLSLDRASVSIGRDTANDICLSDLALSRMHCTIEWDGRVWRIRDRQSSNGTFVNATQVTDRELSDRDRISLGESLFLFVAERQHASSPELSDRPGEVLTRIRVEDASYLQTGAGRANLSRAERDLRELVRIGARINAIPTETQLHRELVELLAVTIPAEQFAVVSVASDGGIHIAESRQAAGVQSLPVSNTVVRQAIQERAMLHTREAAGSDALRAAASVVSAGLQSVLCVPMLVRARALGALYLTTTKKDAFDDDHLQLLTAVANVAAVALDNVRQMAWLQGEKERLQLALDGAQTLVGRSAAMQRIYTLIAKVSRSDATVLITGETGTGKELVARAIHANSDRAKRPFVAINCAALTETLLETELFGHERGAFTGAVAQKKGKLEIADGGTVFLDEVGELAPGLQSKLLRALQQREIERVGGTRPVRLDIRLLSATNRTLSEEVASGRFRRDLFHRLNVVQIDVPSLRERPEDIAPLASHFLARFARKAARPVRGISSEALKCLTAYDWPGNVRELENTIERAIVLGSSDCVLPEDLPEPLLERAPEQVADAGRFHEAVHDAKVRVIIDAFRESRRSYVDTARLLGLHPNYLHRLIRNLGLKPVLEEER
jgi:transcriptional regulator with GAF, ATPase, and Fis domain